MASTTDVAWAVLQGQADTVFRRIALRPAFRDSTGLDLRADRYGLPRATLMTAIQAAAQGQDAVVADRTGGIVHIQLDQGRVAICRRSAEGTENRLIQNDLQLLSPDPGIRREAFLDIAAQFGATGPRADDWLPLLAARPATPEDLDRLYDEMRASLNQWRLWVTEKMESGQALFMDLTNDNPRYFSRLCGPPPGDLPPEEWIAGPLVDHRRRLLDADLISGLAAILPGSIRNDLGPAALVTHLDDDMVWAAVGSLPDFIDPFSLLGLLDIALARRERHSGFSQMADVLVKDLLAEPFRRADGMDLSRFYPALVKMCLQSLRYTEGLGAVSPSWLRLCAFTHAGHLLEIFGQRDFDVDAMIDCLPPANTAFDILGELLSCRSAPMWTADHLTPERIRAEVLGRLFLLRNQEAAAGRSFPHDAEVQAALEQAGSNIHFPGPLDGHRRPRATEPGWSLPEETRCQMLDDLASSPRQNCGRILSWASLLPLDQPVLEAAAAAAGSMDLDGDEPTDALSPLMFLALMAIRQENAALSEAVTERCLREARKLTVEAGGLERCDLLFRVLLAASAVQPDWSGWMASKLVSFTLAMPPGPWHVHLEDLLSLMKQLLPPGEWRFGRAAAYARLGEVA
jgi:hypothetical protein